MWSADTGRPAQRPRKRNMRLLCISRPAMTVGGQRLKQGALAVTVGDKNIYEVTALSIEKLQQFLEELQLT